MKNTSKLFQSGMRALTGVLITAVAATGVVMIGAVNAPNIERDPHGISVDTKQTNERSLVCAGSFAELGADPAAPDLAIPVGEATVVVAGEGELSAHKTASVVTGTASTSLAAAQIQRLGTSGLSGVAASNCVEPTNEQWLVGGGSTLGVSTTLNLGNATDVAATVQISVFDEFGEVADFQTAGVIVGPHSEQIVSLNGYAPEREALAVRVTSTGAPVAASLGVAQVEGLVATGVSTVARQLRAETQLVVPGITNKYEHPHGDEDRPGDAGPADVFPVRVLALTPGTAQGTAFVYAIDADGNRTDLGTIELLPKTLGMLSVVTWPADATALIIDADVPVFGAAEGTAGSESSRDFDWFTPAPTIAAGSEVAAAVVSGGALFLTNTGNTEAVVTIEPAVTGAGDENAGTTENLKTVKVAPGTSVQVNGSGSFTISSTQPIHSGVRMIAASTLAGYPIAPLAERGGELTVFTR